MKAYINLHPIMQTVVDSAAITTLGRVIHQFSNAGNYYGTVLLGSQTMANFQLTVDQHFSASQVQIDLAALCSPPGSAAQESSFELKPGGYAVFHVSQGAGGFAVVVRKAGEQAVAFDSRTLSGDDIFAVTLIRAGSYSVVNEMANAKGTITMAYPTVGNTPYRPPDPVTVECSANAINPADIKLEPLQGQIYRFKAPSRIVITLTHEESRPAGAPPRSIARWSGV